MAAPKGNKFWKARAKHGRDKIFSTPADLWNAAVEYFNWAENHPLWEEKAWCTQGEVTVHRVAKMRAMTNAGLCLFLDVDQRTWTDYANRDDFIPVTSKISAIIYDQKFSGAAADLLNANIIARDLGLKDHATTELTGKDGKDLPVLNFIPVSNKK